MVDTATVGRFAGSPAVNRSQVLRLLVLAGIFGFFFVFYLVPIGRLLLLSFMGDGNGSLAWRPSNGDAFAAVAASPLLIPVILNTLKLSAIVTVVALVFGYPIAYMLGDARARSSMLLLSWCCCHCGPASWCAPMRGSSSFSARASSISY